MPKLVSCVVLVVMLLVSATAAAHVRRADDPLLIAETRAVAYWHQQPCRGEWRVVVALPNPEWVVSWERTYGPGVNAMQAWTTFSSPSAVFGTKADPPSTYTNCVIGFNARVWHSRAVEDESFWLLCSEMIHEFGNALGVPENVPDSGGVMDWKLTEADVPAQCQHYRLRMPSGVTVIA